MTTPRQLTAARMVERGYVPVPLHPGKLAPTMAYSWRDVPELLLHHPDLNLGWQMGTQTNGRRLLALVGTMDALGRAERILGRLKPTVTHMRPGCLITTQVFCVPPDGKPFEHRAQLLGIPIAVRCDVGVVAIAPSETPAGAFVRTHPGPLAELPWKWQRSLQLGELPQETEAPADGDKALERALKYCEQIEPAVAGDAGHKTTFRVACKAREFGLGFDGIMTVLRAYNLRSDPPWSERDLRHKCVSALTCSRAKNGAKL